MPNNPLISLATASASRDRFDSEGRGRRFESFRVRQFFQALKAAAAAQQPRPSQHIVSSSRPNGAGNSGRPAVSASFSAAFGTIIDWPAVL